MPCLLNASTMMVGRQPRRGSWAVFLVLSAGVFLGLFALAFNQAHLWHTRDELRLGGDAAGLAATALLADDEFLANDPVLVPPILDRSRLAALDFAAFHLVRSRPLDISHDGDIRFGVLSTPRGGQLTLLNFAGPIDPSLLLQVNTVVVTAGHTADRQNSVGLAFGHITGIGQMDVEVVSTVTLDRELRGFRPLPEQNVPLAPLALFSDPAGLDAKSWQFAVEQGNGNDAFRFDRNLGEFMAGSDGLREFRALIATDAGQLAQANTALLHFGSTSVPVLADQLVDGLDAVDLAALGGQVLLNAAGEVLVAGTQQGPAEGSADLDELLDALEALEESAEVRAWPLYSQVDTAAGTVQVTGFVAARVVRVQLLGPGQPVEVILQPARLATATAVTAFDLRLTGIVANNAYVGKVRIVE